MIKCEAIKDFTLERFDELKNIKRANKELKGRLFIGDTFECDNSIAEYLLGKNENKLTVIKLLEVIPNEKDNEIVTKSEQPKQKKKTGVKHGNSK